MRELRTLVNSLRALQRYTQRMDPEDPWQAAMAAEVEIAREALWSILSQLPADGSIVCEQCQTTIQEASDLGGAARPSTEHGPLFRLMDES